MPERRSRDRGNPLARYLRERRKVLRLTQAEVAHALRQGRSGYGRLEQGYLPATIGPAWVNAFAHALRVDVATFAEQAQLHRVAGIPPPPTTSDLSAARRLLLASVAHLSDEEVLRLARALMVLYEPPSPAPDSPPNPAN